jgi:hypothetical protein
VTGPDEDFRFDSLKLEFSDLKLVLLEIPSYELPDSFGSGTSFTSKFVNLCPYLNDKNFLVNEKPYSIVGCLYDDIFVRNDGEDVGGCGTQERPCLTIHYGNQRSVFGRHYEEMSVILLFNNDEMFSMKTGCKLEDITLESQSNDNDNVVEITVDAWDSLEDLNLDGVFCILNEASVRFLHLTFILPSSSPSPLYTPLPQKPFIYHSSSGILILESIKITNSPVQTNGNRNIFMNEEEILLTYMKESLIKIINGNGNMYGCNISNINIINWNGSVINALIHSENKLNISNCIFTNSTIREDAALGGSGELATGYGGAIYIEIEKDGRVSFSDCSFNGCNISKSVDNDGSVSVVKSGYGGAIAMFLNDGCTYTELTLSSSLLFVFFYVLVSFYFLFYFLLLFFILFFFFCSSA